MKSFINSGGVYYIRIMKYYYIAHPDKALKITLSGIKADEQGNIVLLTTLELKHSPSQNTIFISDYFALCDNLDLYAIIEVDPKGIDFSYEQENQDENLSRFRIILAQDLIKPGFCKIGGVRRADPKVVHLFTGKEQEQEEEKPVE